MLRQPALACVSLVFSLTATTALGAPTWFSDHEDNALSKWDFLLHPQYLSVVNDPYNMGNYAARAELHSDAMWPGNNLRRVEFHHTPAAGLTSEGATLYFAWSFLLEQTLPTEPSQQIGYWESDLSYQQMMAFQVEGERIRFYTQRPQFEWQWDAPNAATANTWHRIAMKILWSKDPNQGSVDVWFDGTQVVTDARVQTLADDNVHFIQVGLLRGNVDFADVPAIRIDDAVEGLSLNDVRPDLPSMGQGGAAATSSSNGSSNNAAQTGSATGPQTAAGNTTSTGNTTTGGTSSSGGAGSDGGAGEGCRYGASQAEATGRFAWVFSAVLGLCLSRHRRRLVRHR